MVLRFRTNLTTLTRGRMYPCDRKDPGRRSSDPPRRVRPRASKDLATASDDIVLDEMTSVVACERRRRAPKVVVLAVALVLGAAGCGESSSETSASSSTRSTVAASSTTAPRPAPSETEAPAPASSSTTPVTAPQPTTATTAETTTTAVNDVESLGEEWHRLDALCRGQSPADEAACTQRDALTERYVLARAGAFFAAWRAGDLDRARSFMSPEFGTESLEPYTLTADPERCELELDTIGRMTCRAEVAEGDWGIYVVFEGYGAGSTADLVVVMIGPDDVG